MHRRRDGRSFACHGGGWQRLGAAVESARRRAGCRPPLVVAKGRVAAQGDAGVRLSVVAMVRPARSKETAA